jgi:hypothetical protein
MDDPYYEAMMTLTGLPEWELLVEELEKMVYEIQANALEASSWEKVQEDKGFAKGLAYMINLRQQTKLEKKSADV